MRQNDQENYRRMIGTFFTSSLITRISRYFNIYMNNALKPLGINASQYLYVLVICKEGCIRQDKLPARIGINKSNVARSLEQLEKNGLIRRECNDMDKRTYDIYPTDSARAIFEPIMNIIRQWDNEVMEMTSDERKPFRESLEQILFRAENIGKNYLAE